MNAIQSGIRAYNENALVPDASYGWDEYAARLFRYFHYQSYADNTVYSRAISYASQHRDRLKLYPYTRSIYNPVDRQNKLLVANVYRGVIDIQTMEGGALPIRTDNEGVLPALKQVIKWSALGQLLALYVRWAALYGDCGIKVVDDPIGGKVRLEMLHPGKIRDATFDSAGNVKSIIIEYQRAENRLEDGISRPDKTYWYREFIDNEYFRTFKNGEPFGFYQDADGNYVSEWRNPYGFVPVKIAHYNTSGMKWGLNSFYASIGKIDEINDAASLINDQVRKSVTPIWYFAGARGEEDIGSGSTKDRARDAIPAMYGPENSQPYSMVSDLPIDAALSNLKNMLAELERDMPELALQRIREGGNLTAPGVQMGYSDAIGSIQNARKNLDPVLVSALQMAISIGAYNQYPGFEPFTIDSYNRGDIDFDIRERPVIGDTLSRQERIVALQGVGTQPTAIQRMILRELDYSDSEIEEAVTDIETQAQEKQTIEFNANDGNAVVDTLQRLGLDQSLQQTEPPPGV